ncbi:HNH endonuclease [Thioclava sp. FR2]|uniref:HNH endonuclease n=1 Tax=Thioclava sp. FR2 TaxID=3445780 RepID=UPI003EC0B687
MATYSLSTLDDRLKLRRAEQLDQLDKLGQLDGQLKGLSIEEKANRLFEDGEEYWITVAQANLRILEIPVALDPLIVKPTYKRFGLINIPRTLFEGIAAAPQPLRPQMSPDERSFPEGALISRVHLERERDPRVVREAKKRFRERHGKLYCEVCGWNPDVSYLGLHDSPQLIEAHHDVPLASLDYSGQTRLEDIRLLCPNCHRAIHSARPWMRVGDFRNLHYRSH